MKVTIEREIAGRKMILQTGLLAKQANGAVTVQYGDSLILATAVMDSKEKEGLDFFPLTVDYREKYYASGKIPGGFFKREARPTDKETLTCRIIDRPIRPMFPKEFKRETQVMISVFSADEHNDPDIPSMIGAFAALAISDIPFDVSMGAVRIGLVDGQLVVNPTYSELELSDLNLTMAGTRDAIMMVESGANKISEDQMIAALEKGHEVIGEIAEVIDELRSQAQKEKLVVVPEEPNTELIEKLKSRVQSKLHDAILVKEKSARSEALSTLRDEAAADLLPAEDDPGYEAAVKEIKNIFHDLEGEEMRRMVLEEGLRADGRGPSDIRPISSEVGFVPKAHGSAVFTRGETQSLGTTTLGTSTDELIIDNLQP
ncbi:MAG: polyribonucleotide nucleotidyltransferase, partial [Candidatus Omnitrophica bacterium]|nr:polyribonucleotide nucleotidyltransferase [Candidatus Omnitrophota bacterium]